MHPIFENCRRPTAALDRNLAYLGLVEILHGYPIDAVVLTTGCDKTTPARIMAASTVDIPAIVLSGGPMLDGWLEGELVGSGTVIWSSRRARGRDRSTKKQFLEAAAASAPSPGHCNTMGTASTMNAVAEALRPVAARLLGDSRALPRARPDGLRNRASASSRWRTRTCGRRRSSRASPSSTPSRPSRAIGGSTNAQPHLMAMARHAGVELIRDDWMEYGHDIPLLLNMQPAGKYLGERFHRAGGVPAVLWELLRGGQASTATR